ncbi:MAG: RpiB/LacA/LacB family sugar-phosphate isomerase [Candidatus Uhrbacteria bacterium]|nr:RpiB/LacA/LacB family sugar-phosphate isomerase [Candidatus Uhrbacteria bacterium]
MLVYLGADHAGFALKGSVKDHLETQNISTEDLGAFELDPSDDYPAVAATVAKAVLANPRSLGILFCGNAEGIAIAANKFDGIRAGIGYSVEAAKTMRNDDNANVLCVPGRLRTVDEPFAIVDAFLATPFSGEERHVRRLKELSQLEVDN